MLFTARYKKWWTTEVEHRISQKYTITSTKLGINTIQKTSPLSRVIQCIQRPSSSREIKKRDTRRRKAVSLLPLPSKTLKRRRPRHPGFLQPGSVPCVHCVSPVHVPRVEVSFGVRKASLSHSVVLAHYQRVVERRERCLVLLPPQMFGRLRTHAGSAAGDQRRRPHFPRIHPPRNVGFKIYIFLRKNTL